jgi:SEC-C motif
MSTPAQINANRINADASTGPRTDDGKSSSSRNSISHGLFAMKDFIRPGEEETYADLAAALNGDLRPVGTLEHNLVDEIRGAIWRLNRCRDIEAGFVATLGSGHPEDPMQNEATARLQNSVDRARAHSHRLLQRCTSELRRLQTGRRYLNEIFPDPKISLDDLGISDWQSITKSLSEFASRNLRQQKTNEAGWFASLLKDAAEKETLTFAKRTQSATAKTEGIARSAPCPCKSGRKYKRCCGENAPPMHMAA